MKRVVIESPYAGNVKKNEEYARACLKDSLDKGEAPFASHLLYTQKGVLNDTMPTERSLGINAGFAWGKCADLVVFYMDLGMSGGMVQGEVNAVNNKIPMEFRTLGGEW